MTAPAADLAVLDQVSLAHRFARARVKIDGDVFDPLAVPYLIELYDNIHPNVVVMKGAQLGVTAWAILSVIERMRTGVYPRGVLYGFPSQEEVYDFAQARFDKILRDNAAFFAGAIRSTDRTELKQIGTAMLYFRGVRVADKSRRPSKLLSIPVDCLVLDEHDDMDPYAVEVVQSRLDSSKLRHQIVLGHPTLPRWGISAKYEDGDQRAWMVRCHACNADTVLEDEFPHCLGRRDQGEYFRCCVKCKREIYVHDGRWVPRYPGRDVWSYQISQLMSSRKPMGVIVAEYEKMGLSRSDEAIFWNLVMAKPFANQDDALDRAVLAELFQADKPEELAHIGPTFLGADVGKRTIHVTIGSLKAGERGHIHWIGELKTFDELFDLGKKHHVQTGVIDAMAETRSVTDFCKRTHWAWGCQYVETANPLPHYDWVSANRVVRVGRTQTIDSSHRAMTQHRLTFRRANAYSEEVFVPQMLNLVRVKQMNDKTGSERVAWHITSGKTKNDHFRHAVNYAWIASTSVGIAQTDPRGARPREGRPRSWMLA
ncbi:MAG TPA: phage terminase large subunit family protein [Polyangia bacterium]|nr:phage terminase large subunit family protein [Polyangia bacterium]